MFRIQNSSLPAQASNYKLAPLARLWMGSRKGMGALLRVNVLAGKQAIAQVFATPDPTYQGQLVKSILPDGVDIFGIADYAMSDPVKVRPFEYWTDSGNLYLYVLGTIPSTILIGVLLRSHIVSPDSFVYKVVNPNSSVNAVNTGEESFVKSPDSVLSAGEFIQDGQTVAIASATSITVGQNLKPVTEEDWNYKVVLPTSDIAVTSILSQGLQFLPATQSRPLPGEFQQLGAQLIICGSPQFHLDLGQDVVITGNTTLSLAGTALLKVATFYLPTVVYLEKIEWLGISFSPAKDARNPQSNEFVWDKSGYATVFY